VGSHWQFVLDHPPRYPDIHVHHPETRLRPTRDVSKDAARIDLWVKALAPSTELRRWYGHDPNRWPEFRSRYLAELETQPEAVQTLAQQIARGPVTFVYASRETHRNSATVLKAYLEGRLQDGLAHR
jgi:uncharacterized protein YeaO (DUF488 family)